MKDSMPRSEFLRLMAVAPWLMPALLGMSEETADQRLIHTQQHRMPRIVPMLTGPFGKDTDLESWFETMGRWGVRQWTSWLLTTYLAPYRCPPGQVSTFVPFLADAMPEFKPYLNVADLRAQENHLQTSARLCRQNGIEFWCNLPFPIFPTRDKATVKKVVPHLYQAGKLNIYHPELANILRREVQTLKKAMPELCGISLFLCEGGGGADFTREDLQRIKEWELPLMKAFEETTKELRISGNVFAHHYMHTVRTHRNVYEIMANVPKLAIMEDITWPEEDMLHPFLGYLPRPDRDLLFRTNPVHLLFLLDTEYIGQGILPSVYPRWWKHNIAEAVRSGVKTAIGRVFFWDGGRTDVNFNRLNAYIFTRLCHDPDADARQLLGEAAREMFGDKIPQQLVDILWETEPVIKQIIGLNGVDALDHSRLPQPKFIDALYTPSSGMKAVDDLFSAPGTVLHPELTDKLVNTQQWRWQNKIVSLPAEAYLDEKRQAMAWVTGILPEIKQLSRALAPQHQEMFIKGYDILGALAHGMELFVETADVHRQWARAKTLDDAAAKAKFRDLAARWESLATQVPENPLLYHQRMLAWAEFLRNSLPRISNP